MKPIRIGLIGYGAIGRVHMMGYRAIPLIYGLPADAVQVVGVATSRGETAAAAAREIGCELYSADYRDLLTQPDIDMIDCCTPNGSHHEIIVAAAAAGKHIYCEKPLSLTVAEGEAMVESVERAGIKHQMTFNFRFIPAIARAKQLIEAGFVGNIFSFRGRFYRPSYIDPHKPMSWKLRRETSGGGALYDLGSHVLDLLYYLLGDFGSVQAMLETLIPERPIAAGSSEREAVTVDDLALLHLRMASGAVGTVDISRMGTGTTIDLQIEIYGDKGAIRFRADDPSWLEVYDVRDEGKPLGGMRGFRKIETVQHYEDALAPDWTQPLGFDRTHTECQYRFLRAIWDDQPASPSLAEGLKIQAVMAAAQQSDAESRWVDVE